MRPLRPRINRGGSRDGEQALATVPTTASPPLPVGAAGQSVAPQRSKASGPSSRGQAGFGRSGLNTIATSWISVVVSFATSIVIARSLGPTIKGGYDLTNATGNLAALALGLSLDSGTAYVVARGFVKPGALVRPLFWWAIAQGAITAFTIVALYTTPLADAVVPTSLGLAVVLPLAAFVTLMSLNGYLRSVLMGQRRIIAANKGDLTGRLFVPLVICASFAALLVVGGRPGVLLFLWCNVAGLVVTCILFLHQLRPELRDAGGPKRPRAIVSFAFPAYVSNVVQFLNYRLDLFLVNVFLGMTAVGLYALAVSVAQLIWLLPQAAAAVLLPHVAADVETAGGNALRSARVARLTFLTCASGAIVLAVSGRVLIPFVYGKAFLGSLDAFLWLLPGITTYSLYTVLAAHIAGTGRPRLMLWISCVALVVTLVLTLALIPRIGIRGAAIASTVSYTTSAALGTLVFVRLTRLSPRLLFIPTRDDFALAGKALARLRSLPGGLPRARP